MDKIKPDSKSAMKELHKMGIETYMITGDNNKTAKVVASEVGIDHVISDVLPNEKLDKDRFRRDLGDLVQGYEEVLSRMNK